MQPPRGVHHSLLKSSGSYLSLGFGLIWLMNCLNLSGDLKGMVDPGETVMATLRREFGEEAMNCLQADEPGKAATKIKVDKFFQKNGDEVNTWRFCY